MATRQGLIPLVNHVVVAVDASKVAGMDEVFPENLTNTSIFSPIVIPTVNVTKNNAVN